MQSSVARGTLSLIRECPVIRGGEQRRGEGGGGSGEGEDEAEASSLGGEIEPSPEEREREREFNSLHPPCRPFSQTTN